MTAVMQYWRGSAIAVTIYTDETLFKFGMGLKGPKSYFMHGPIECHKSDQWKINLQWRKVIIDASDNLPCAPGSWAKRALARSRPFEVATWLGRVQAPEIIHNKGRSDLSLEILIICYRWTVEWPPKWGEVRRHCYLKA